MSALAILVIVAACAKDPTAATAPNTSQQPALSAADAQAMSEAVSADMEGELEGLTAFGTPFAPLALTSAFGDDDHGDHGGCMPTISPLPITNSDGDRVPDSIRVTFTGCAFSEGDEADTVKGSIDIIDPTAKVTDHDAKIVFTDFTRIEVEDGRRHSLELNGTRQLLRDSSMISLSEINFTTVYTYGDGKTATNKRNWSSVFTADVAGSIKPDARLPSGTLNVNGTSMWTRDTSTYSLTVSTSPVLHYNAACTVRPKFDAGTFKAVVVRHGMTSTVTVQFTACGQYTVTRS
jgi:hypothetical protein